MPSLKHFNEIYVNTTNYNDIISFNELINTFDITRKELIQYLKEHNIYYDAFKVIGTSKGFIRFYKKMENPIITTSPSIDTNSLSLSEPIPDILQDNIIELNKNYKPIEKSTKPYDILHSIHLEDLLKYSPVIITKYKFKIDKYTELFENSENDLYKQKVIKYKQYLTNKKQIKQIHDILSLYLSTFNTIIIMIYGRIYDTYEEELNKMNFENIKYDSVLGVYYTNYLNQINQSYKSKTTKKNIEELYNYISENYESAILEKKLSSQQKAILDNKFILHKKNNNSNDYTYKINSIRITMEDIQEPSLDFLVNIVQLNDLLSDFYYGQTYGKIAINIYKILIKCIYNFKEYDELINLYKKKKNDKNNYYFKTLLKLKD